MAVQGTSVPANCTKGSSKKLEFWIKLQSSREPHEVVD